MRRYNYITCLRWLATVGIVIWHVSGNFHPNSVANYLPFLMINESVKWSLPLFIMISGALLLNEGKKNEDNRYFFKNRINKILIPFIFWTIFYTILKAVIEYKGAHTVSGMKLLNDIFLGGSYYHMWFLNLIIILYIFTPMIRKILYRQTHQRVKYAISLLFSFAIVINLIKFLHGFTLNIPVQLVLFLPYFIAGYYQSSSNEAPGTLLSLFLFVFSILVAISGAAILSFCSNNSLNNLYFGGSLSPTTVIATLTLFSIFKKHKDSSIFSYKTFQFMNKFSYLTFGIYLIHPFIIFVSKHVGLHNIWPIGSIQIIATSFVVLSLSFFLCWLISSLPYLRKVI